MGRVVRLLPPLGLNVRTLVPAAKRPSLICWLSQRLGDTCRSGARNNACSKPTLLDPPADDAEVLERSVTFWQAFCCDRFMSAWCVTFDPAAAVCGSELTSVAR